MLVSSPANTISKSTIVLLPLGFIIFGCIEQYTPPLKDYEDVLVIDGAIIKGDSLQKVIVSHSTAVFDSKFIPVSDCIVKVKDRSGNEYTFVENEEGLYTASISEENLYFGAEFQLNIVTPDGNEYLSGYESIMESSAIDSVYFIVEDQQSALGSIDKGIQLYTDLKAPDGATKNYLWTVEETWEIHTFYTIQGFFEKGSEKEPVFDPWYGKYSVCWSTEDIKQYFTSSTESLSVNEKKKIPLSFLSGKSPKINVKYSALVKQFSISREAYKYHTQNNFAVSGSEGLYQSQPAQPRSNIHNISDPEELVLGYFWASSYTEKRTFFTGPLTGINDDHCEYIHEIAPKGDLSLVRYLQAMGKDVYLIVLDFGDNGPRDVELWGFPAKEICINCRAEGGTTQKPEFWK